MKKHFLLLILLFSLFFTCSAFAVDPCTGEHLYGDWEIKKAATCFAAGVKTRTCTICGDVFYGTIDKLPHDWDDGVVTPATYDTDGVKTFTCKVCSEQKTEPIDKLIKASSITVTPASKEVKLNEGPITLTKTVQPENAANKEVEWRSSNENVAYVSPLGVVTLIGKGNATITAIAKDGYGASGSCVLTVIDDSEPEKYTLTVTAGTGGSVNNSVNGEYTKGTQVQIIATANDGYSFAGWKIGQATEYANPYTITVNGNITANAVFTKNPTTSYHVTVTAGVGGTAAGGGDYPAGSTATLTATPALDYNFLRWEIGSATYYSNPCTLEVYEDIDAVAVFTRKPDMYTITYMPGTDCAGSSFTDSWPSGTAYLAGQSFFKNNYTQTGWSLTQGGAKAYNLDQVITLTKNLVLYPYWTKNAGTLKLTVKYDGQGVVYLNGAKVTSGTVYDIAEGQSYTFQMTPNSEDYYVYSINFAGKYWNANAGSDGFWVNYEMMKAENRTLTIKFDSVTASPKTGDDSNLLLWSVLSGVSFAAVATAVVLKKKYMI